MAGARDYDPKDVKITKVDKRGEYHTVEGVAEGRKITVHIPAPSLEQFRSVKAGEAYLRRSLLGTKRMEERGEHKG
jgi:hypothetical protein